VFVNFDPVDGIPPGRNWERELYVALRRSDAVVAIDSTGWRLSQWCFAEIALARSLGKAVIVVRARDARPATGAAQLASDAQHISITGFTETSLEPLFVDGRSHILRGAVHFWWNWLTAEEGEKLLAGFSLETLRGKRVKGAVLNLNLLDIIVRPATVALSGQLRYALNQQGKGRNGPSRPTRR
jgi:hypothetical protein